jgi:hypothetical protein
MARLTSISLLDSGRYYSTKPTVVVDPPVFDSSRFTLAMIDSQEYKFGCGALNLDSDDTVLIGTLDSDYQTATPLFRHNMMSMWINLDSVIPSTIVWGQNYRVHVDSAGHLGLSWVSDSASAQFHVSTIYDSSNSITQNNWHFIKIEVSQDQLRFGVDSAHTPSGNFNNAGHTMYLSAGNFWDSGATINLGHDSDNASPLGTIFPHSVTQNPVSSYKGINGTIDNFNFTSSITDSQRFMDVWTNWVPESADDYYKNTTPVFEENWDYRRAKLHVRLDSVNNSIGAITIIDSGCGYDSVPKISFIGGNNIIDSDYDIGDSINQTLSTTIMRGEVARYQLDSAGDSNRYLYLIHSGADDGKFHNFVSDIAVINSSNNSVSGLFVKSATEINKLSNNEQNTEFTTISDDFLDFSEDNPFGDPENN